MISRLIFDVHPDEKDWLENTVLAATPGTAKIALLRQLLDDYAQKHNLSSRPGSKAE